MASRWRSSSLASSDDGPHGGVCGDLGRPRGQKPIVIGARGERLRRVGRAARLELNRAVRRALSSEAVGEGARGLGRRCARPARSWGWNEPPHCSASQLARAYVLHQRPFRDTSLILEVFAREHGRLTLFAHGARGPRSRFTALQPFRPLLLSWSGRGEAPTLAARRERRAGAGARCPAQLLSGFYLNELLLKLADTGRSACRSCLICTSDARRAAQRAARRGRAAPIRNAAARLHRLRAESGRRGRHRRGGASRSLLSFPPRSAWFRGRGARQPPAPSPGRCCRSSARRAARRGAAARCAAR